MLHYIYYMYESVVYVDSGLVNTLSIVNMLYVVVGFYIFWLVKGSMNKGVQFCFQKLTMLFYYFLPVMS